MLSRLLFPCCLCGRVEPEPCVKVVVMGGDDPRDPNLKDSQVVDFTAPPLPQEMKVPLLEGERLVKQFASAVQGRWLNARQLVALADVDGDGEVSFKELEDLVITQLHLDITTEALQALFTALDSDGSGSLTVEELTSAIARHEKHTRTVLVPGQQNFPETQLVGIVAHNEMKVSMMAFVEKNLDFFQKVSIVTTGTTGRALETKLGMHVKIKVCSGPLVGDQEIGGLISQGKVASLFFFRDPLSAHPHTADIDALARIADVHDVMSAYNPSTAMSLIYAMKNCQVSMAKLEKTEKADPDSKSAVVQRYIKAQAAKLGEITENEKS